MVFIEGQMNISSSDILEVIFRMEEGNIGYSSEKSPDNKTRTKNEEVNTTGPNTLISQRIIIK